MDFHQLRAVLAFTCPSEPNIPQYKLEPSFHNVSFLAFQILILRLFFACINHCLNPDCGSVPSQILDIALHLEVSLQLKQVFDDCWSDRQDDLRVENDYSVFIRLVLEERVVVVIEIHSDVQIHGLYQVEILHLRFVIESATRLIL